MVEPGWRLAWVARLETGQAVVKATPLHGKNPAILCILHHQRAPALREWCAPARHCPDGPRRDHIARLEPVGQARQRNFATVRKADPRCPQPLRLVTTPTRQSR